MNGVSRARDVEKEQKRAWIGNNVGDGCGYGGETGMGGGTMVCRQRNTGQWIADRLLGDAF